MQTPIALLPNGLCGTVTVTATTTSGPAVEQNSVREKQHQMLSSQLQDYLSLNKLHYCLYYAGIHRLGKSTLQNHCLPTTSRPHAASFDYRARKGWRAGEGVGFMGGKHEVHLFSGCVRLTQVNVEGGFSIHKRKKIIINLFASQSLGKRICISASIFYNISFTTFTMFLFVFTVTVYWLSTFWPCCRTKIKIFSRFSKMFLPCYDYFLKK